MSKPYKNLLSLQSVSKHFDIKLVNGKKAVLKAVNGVTFNIREGETFGIVGESGCGKSTLGRLLLGLYDLTDGTISYQGKALKDFNRNEMKQFRRESQMIFQDPSGSLNPRRTIKEILKEPFKVHRMFSEEERQEKIDYLCEMVGISKQYYDRYPHEMSGGQKQRIGIARALALKPKFIVCDEPVSALDVSIQAQVINLLKALQEKFELTYIFISHNLSVVKYVSDRIAVMYLGKFVELAPAEKLYQKPLHPYTEALISSIPQVGDSVKRDKIVLEGDLPSPVHQPTGCKFHTRCPKIMPICKDKEPILTEMEEKHFVACHLYHKV
ncbi:MAG: ATP-binding cassette domain-containing protein [Eubacteriaceae bacterium]|jgi:oligopeptide/dipeptide ABC transporter ATP-binding protein|nr:ATP-binding cassette domain-containing protein [Eubacteriaceae bacterium]